MCWRRNPLLRGAKETAERGNLRADLTILSGPAVLGLLRWNRDWRAMCCELAQNRRSWAVVVRDVVTSTTNKAASLVNAATGK